MSFTGGVFKTTLEVISREDITSPSFDLDTGECTYTERVFAEVGAELWKNDKRHFLVSLSLATDTVTFKLFKNGIEIASSEGSPALIADGIYGDYNPPGTWPDQPKKASFYADFEKIYNLEGAGVYQIKADRVIINNGSTLSSIQYQLMPYSALGARGTIKLTTVQNGMIENGIDYTGMEFEQQIRIPVMDVHKQPREDIIDNYRDTNQNVEQIQDGIIKRYRFKTAMIPGKISSQLMDDMLLANIIGFTSHDVFSNEILIDVPVFKSETVDEQYPGGQSFGWHEIILENRRFTRKRN
jgi:hypothetical protein